MAIFKKLEPWWRTYGIRARGNMQRALCRHINRCPSSALLHICTCFLPASWSSGLSCACVGCMWRACMYMWGLGLGHMWEAYMVGHMHGGVGCMWGHSHCIWGFMRTCTHAHMRTLGIRSANVHHYWPRIFSISIFSQSVCDYFVNVLLVCFFLSFPFFNMQKQQ